MLCPICCEKVSKCPHTYEERKQAQEIYDRQGEEIEALENEIKKQGEQIEILENKIKKLNKSC